MLPNVFESPSSCGILKTELSVRWKLPKGILVAAGAGDVACGGVAVGAVNENTGFISMGTAAQVFLGSKKFDPRTKNLVHSFCHALPSTWFNMAALLNGTSIMDKVLSWTSEKNIESLIFSASNKFRGPGDLLALPYLSGERTPHNDSKIRGAYASSIGAARLARLAAKNESMEDVIVTLPVTKSFRVDQAMHARYADKLKQFRALYAQLRS